MTKIKIVIITPIYQYSNGGASVYFNSITKALGNKYDFNIISESSKKNIIGYYGIFPKRGSIEYKNFFHKILLYLFENLTYFRIFKIMTKLKPEVVHIHSSYFNNPNIFPFIFLICRLIFKTKFILDARDKMINKYFFKFVKYFDKIICCSLDIEKIYLSILNDKFKNKIIQIPVLISNNHNIHKNLIPKVLLNKKYIFYAGLIKTQKRIDLIIETFQKLTSKKDKDLYLVLAGTIKDKKEYFYSKFKDKKIFYFQAMSNTIIQSIINESLIAINVSPNEGVPQFCLESIANNTLVILPPNISEFNKFARENVFTGSSSEQLNDLILKIIDQKIYPNYPISDHFIENQISKYIEIYEK